MIMFSHAESGLQIELHSEKAAVLVVEEPVLLREMLIELSQEIQGEPGGYILSEDFEPIPMGKAVNFIPNPLDINCNEKKILGKVYQNIVSEDRINNSLLKENYMQAYINFLTDICLHGSVPLVFDASINIMDLLKIARVEVDQKSNTYLENLCNYLRICKEVLNYKVVIIVNLKNYLLEEELDLFYKQCFYDNICLLLIEALDTSPNENEKKYIIDKSKSLIYY